MLFGIVEVGRLLWVKQALTETAYSAVRRGARIFLQDPKRYPGFRHGARAAPWPAPQCRLGRLQCQHDL
nr:TadE family protein [Sphingomonas trueperi]